MFCANSWQHFEQFGLWIREITFSDLFQHRGGFGQLRIKYSQQHQTLRHRIPQRIVNLVALLAAQHDLTGAKDNKVLRGIGLFELHFSDELACRKLAFAKGFNNRDAGGMRRSLERSWL